MAEPSAPKSDADEARQHPTRQFRDAYEALIEPMINATIKLAEAESLQQNQRAHIEAVEAQLAAMSRISAEWREHTATLKRAWTSTRGVIGRRLLWWVARLAGSWRLTWSSPRAMWGVTPILTLPLLAKCDRLLGVRSESLVFTVYHTTNSFDINLKGICDAGCTAAFPAGLPGFTKPSFTWR
jgi:hypothetical protein